MREIFISQSRRFMGYKLKTVFHSGTISSWLLRNRWFPWIIQVMFTKASLRAFFPPSQRFHSRNSQVFFCVGPKLIILAWQFDYSAISDEFPASRIDYLLYRSVSEEYPT